MNWFSELIVSEVLAGRKAPKACGLKGCFSLTRNRLSLCLGFARFVSFSSWRRGRVGGGLWGRARGRSGDRHQGPCDPATEGSLPLSAPALMGRGGPSCKSLRLFPSQSTVKLLHQASSFVKNAMHGEFLVNSSATPMGALPPSAGSGVLLTSPVSVLHVEGGLNAPVLWGPDERQTSLRTKLRGVPHHPALTGDYICK